MLPVSLFDLSAVMKYKVLSFLALISVLSSSIFSISVLAAQADPNTEISTIESNSRTESLDKEESDFLKKKGAVTMCVDPDWMPMERIHNGRHDGISADFMKLIEDYIGIPIQLVKTESWSESIAFAKARKCDIFSLAMSTPERLQYMSFTTPYLRLPLVLATRKETSYVSDVSLLTEEKLGIVAGYAFGEILRKRYPDMQITDVASLKEGLVKVENGELYGVIDTLASIGFLIQRGYPELKISGKFDEYWELGVGIRNDEPLLFSSLEKAVLRIDKKTAQQILNSWISVKYEQGFDYGFLWKVLAIILAVLAFIFYRQHLLKRYNQELVRQIDGRTRDLVRAKEKAEAANKEKSRFLANMSHELRTPMHAIRSFTKLTLKRDLDAKARHFLENIDASTDRLTRLLNDLLDLSKLESGKMELDPQNCNVKELIDNTVESLGSLIKEHQLQLDVSGLDEINATIDVNLITQVITNLLSNAIKYSPDYGKIILACYVDGQRLKFSIEDEGLGVPPEEHEAIFDSFVQSSKTRSQSGGTGLGLPISKEIVELHAGKIWVQSPPPNQPCGSVFSFEIPLRQN